MLRACYRAITRLRTGLPSRRSSAVADGVVCTECRESLHKQGRLARALVSYSYDFGGADRIYVENLGIVPAKGSYHHLVPGSELAFWDADKRTILKRAALVETVSVAAKPPLNEVPTSDEFPSSYRSFPWQPSRSLQERANTVLGKYFNYLPRADNQVTYLSTTYAPLQLASDMTRRGVVAQVSLLLSFPHDVAPDKYVFRVHVLTKEGRALSDEMRATTNANVVNAANKFVDDLVAELGR